MLRPIAILTLAALTLPSCRTTDDESSKSSMVTAAPAAPADPDALAYVQGRVAEALFDAFDVPEQPDQALTRKSFQGSLILACSKSGRDVYYCALNQLGSAKVLLSFTQEAAATFYDNFKVSEKTLGQISTKSFEGPGMVTCQFAKSDAGRGAFFCDLTGEGVLPTPAPLAALKGPDADALYKALRIKEVKTIHGKAKELAASLYIRCVKSEKDKFDCLLKTGGTSLALVKGAAAQALYRSLTANEVQRSGKTIKEFEGQARVDCRDYACEVSVASASPTKPKEHK